MKRYSLSMLVVVLCGFALFIGCSEDFYGDPEFNKPPELWLSSGPVEGDTTGYQVHFYWSGWDPDGEIDYFEFVVADGDPLGFNSVDTTGLDKWTRTTVHDSVFRVSADDSPRPYEENDLFTKYDKTHTFFIRAVDMQGMRSEPAMRSFTAWTLAPTINIDRPELVGSGTQSYSTIITFGWQGRDPIDDPSNSQDPEFIRYMWSLVLDTDGVYSDTFDLVRDLNNNPWRYEDRWSPWIDYRADGDSGRVTVIGDDEILQLGKNHVFAVQAKDEAGAISSVFVRNRDIRQFVVSVKQGPYLTVNEVFIGSYRFIGDKMNPVKKDLPPGVPLNFNWSATAISYGGEVVSYRYGWDVQDLSNPDDWDVTASPYHLEAPERKLYSGTHTFYIEVVDNGGRITLGQIMIEVIPFTMERNLYWVDDFFSVDPQSQMYETPGESNHDTFWVDICRRADGFKEDRDVFDCYYDNNAKPPGIREIGQYKNIIWTYSSSQDGWRQLIVFTPESRIGQSGDLPVNYLSLFLAKGGHLWSLGRSERHGGLAAVFQSLPLFPASFKFDMAEDQSDTSGVNCMGYKDYCVSILDKVLASFRTDPDEIPQGFSRDIDDDAMKHAYRDDEDPVTASHPELPEQLDLWEEVTKEGRFFDPRYRGLLYVEVYDPWYYMDFMLIPSSQECFHPMYRMKARNSKSYINDQTVAIWVTKYSGVEPDVKSGIAVAANSFHFGFPLWFFKRDQVNQIVDVVFTEWQIKKTP